MLGLIFTLLILQVWVRSQFVTESFRFDSLRQEIKRLEEAQASHRLEWDEMSSPRAIDQINDQRRWSLSDPQSWQVRHLDKQEPIQ